MPATPDAPSHPALLDRLAYQDAVLLELLRHDGVEERVAAGVERQDEDGEDLGALERDEVQAEGGGEREERYRCPAAEVREDEESHAFRYPRVVRVPRLRSKRSGYDVNHYQKVQ